MGFMDKLKSVGKKAAYGAILASVRKYGTVSEGKYKGCQIGADSHGETLLFIMVAKENGRHVIKEDISSIDFRSIDKNNDIFHLDLNFKDGEKSAVVVSSNKNQGSALPTAEQRLAAQFADMADFLTMFVGKVEYSNETKDLINLIMRYTGRKEIA